MSDKFLKDIIKKVKKYDNTVKTYTKLGKTPSIPYRAFINYADNLFMLGCTEMAEALLNNAANFASPDSNALINLGMIKQTSDEHEKAIEYFKKAYKKDPLNVKALCLWGNSLTALHDTENAIKKYEKAIEINPKSWEAYLYWGLTLIGEHKYSEAKEKLELSVEYNPKEIRTLFLLASIETELGMYDDALLKYIFIINVTDNNFGAYHNIAYIYFKKKEYEKTIEYAQKSIGIAPFKVESYLLLGDTYLLQKRYKEAAGIYECGEKNNIKSIFMYISWGSIFQMKGKYQEAIDKYLKGIELCPDQANAELYGRLAGCYYEIGDIDNAQMYANKTIELEPKNNMALQVVSDISIQKGDFQKALQTLEICLQKSKTKAVTYHKMAKCYFMLGDIEKSNDCFDKSLEYNRDEKSVLYEYVESLLYQKQYALAEKKLNILEKLSNDELEILSLVFRVHYNLAQNVYNKTKAIKTAQKIKEQYPDKFRYEEQYNELMMI